MLRKRRADRADLNRCSLRSRRRGSLMRILPSVVFPKPLLMPTGQSQSSKRAGVRAQLVGDQQSRSEALLLQQFAQQPLGRLLVASALDQNIEHDPGLVHGAPQPVLHTGDVQHEASGAGQLHPRALSEPDVILSHHPAPIVRPRP